jgi:holo-[acyl-carrier protein] synthase
VVIGLGIDVASVERVARALERFGDRLWERVLTEGERADAVSHRERAQFLAGRFAAKEAAYKALGGPPRVLWHDIEVRRAERGRPRLELLGEAGAQAERLGVTQSLVSLSHDAGVAAAVVVLERA